MNEREQLVLYPYLSQQGWTRGSYVFDDERTRIKNEPFVLGMSEMIARLVSHKGLKNPEEGFKLVFSSEDMESDTVLEWIRSDDENTKPGDPGSSSKGNWYRATIAGLRMEGWLCPMLQSFYDAAPQRICIRVENLPEGVNPIWNPEPGQHTKCFVTGEELIKRNK